jgi:hypothetical protein
VHYIVHGCTGESVPQACYIHDVWEEAARHIDSIARQVSSKKDVGGNFRARDRRSLFHHRAARGTYIYIYRNNPCAPLHLSFLFHVHPVSQHRRHAPHAPHTTCAAQRMRRKPSAYYMTDRQAQRNFKIPPYLGRTAIVFFTLRQTHSCQDEVHFHLDRRLCLA